VGAISPRRVVQPARTRSSDSTGGLRRRIAARRFAVAVLSLPLVAACTSHSTRGVQSLGSPVGSATSSSAAVQGPTLGPSTPPSTGSVTQVETGPVIRTASPVPLRSPAVIPGSVKVSLTRLESIQAKSTGLPGEISGPALRVSVRIDNGSSKPLNLDEVFVSLHDATGADGSPMSGNGSVPFTGTLAPGGTATGVYVFSVPGQHRNPVTVTVLYSPSTAAVVFRGNAQ
jgi:hypothetical protein